MHCKRILTLGIGLAAATALLLGGCGSDTAKLKSTKEEQTPVMTVDGIDVPYEIYRYVALNYKAQYEAEAGGDTAIWDGAEGSAFHERLNEHVDETIINLYATQSLCAQYDIAPDDDVIAKALDQKMEELYEQYADDMALYRENLAEAHMTDSVYRFLIRNDLLADELFFAMYNAGEFPDGEEALQPIFASDEIIRVKQILISATNGSSDEENRAKIEEIYRLVESGADFDTLIHEYGQDLYLFNNDDGYYIAKGTRHPEFEEAAFSLAVGETSGIVHSDAGYSIIKRYEKDDAYLKSHYDDLRTEYYSALYNIRLETYAAGLTIERLPALDKYSIFTME